MADRCYFKAKGREFSQLGFRDAAISSLTSRQVQKFDLNEAQKYAWDEELNVLDGVAAVFPDATFAFEYMIPRMGRRVDVALLVDNGIFILEFKVGEAGYPVAAEEQLLDYVFDLQNFHQESHDRAIVPVLVCTKAEVRRPSLFDESAGEFGIKKTNGCDLCEIISEELRSGLFGQKPLDHEGWLNARYSPTPTIVEAAQALYQSNEVEDISRSEAGLTNISQTTECVNAIINKTKAAGRKAICFVTGVPGAGKTLVGLNLASTRSRVKDGNLEEMAVFLSGNGPLIEVIQASLVEDQMRRNLEKCELCKAAPQASVCKGCPYKQTKGSIEGRVKSFVQGVHHFREYYFDTEEPPVEHVAIFDEAQRAWTEDQLSFKMKTRRQNKREVHKSEPHVLIDYLDRHEDWATIVCLVGGGQEINQGEAGIMEWFKALSTYYPEWDIYVSSEIQSEVYLGESCLNEVVADPFVVDELHLSVDMRSFRNKNVAAFADALVNNEPQKAKDLYEELFADYPIYVTRDLEKAKEWVRSNTKRPSDRYGIVADSYGQRIRADGVLVPSDFDAVKWFLRGKDEIDSSYQMEIAASEFKIQGLEIDYAVVAWEGDYRYSNGSFGYHKFYGGRWTNVKADIRQRYLKNGYRVLLTRARQGFVIYVPKGSRLDATRKPEFYDGTYKYLLSAGIRQL